MKKTNEKGVTLITLTITIAILIILAGIIDVVIQNDIFDKAKDIKNNTSSDINSSQNRIENIIKSLPEIDNDLLE